MGLAFVRFYVDSQRALAKQRGDAQPFVEDQALAKP
jgi:hypothetical protein